VRFIGVLWFYYETDISFSNFVLCSYVFVATSFNVSNFVIASKARVFEGKI
jgi:hypothetical protein